MNSAVPRVTSCCSTMPSFFGSGFGCSASAVIASSTATPVPLPPLKMPMAPSLPFQGNPGFPWLLHHHGDDAAPSELLQFGLGSVSLRDRRAEQGGHLVELLTQHRVLPHRIRECS